MTKPTILIVPGSFASFPTQVYSVLLRLLRSKGYPALALQLPSTQKRMPLPPANMSNDADVIRRAVETLLGQGKEVVVVAHSYGGTPMTQGLAGLGGKGVKKMVYLSAIVPTVGKTHAESMGMTEENSPLEIVEGYFHIDPITMAAAICNDLSWEEAYTNALLFPHHSAASFSEKVTQAAYTEIPTSYILCEQDLVVPPVMQKGFIKILEEAGDGEVSVRTLDAGHCPNWSKAEELAGIIVDEAEK